MEYVAYLLMLLFAGIIGAIISSVIDQLKNACKHEGKWSEIQSRLCSQKIYDNYGDFEGIETRVEKFQFRYCDKCGLYEEVLR